MSAPNLTDKAEYRRLGENGIRVSVPILGCMTIGSPNWIPSTLGQEEAFLLLKKAWDLGVTTWDLANMYSNGECQTVVGNFIKQFNIPRNNLVLIDKIACLVDHEEPSTVTSLAKPWLGDTRDYVNHGGLSRSAIFNQVEDSLKRLGTDYIDILLIHVPDPGTPFEETMRALDDLVRSGKVRYIGASNISTWQFIEMNNVAKLHGWTTFSCVQMEHSLLYRCEERELLSYCRYKGIGFLSYAPFMAGDIVREPGTMSERAKSVKGTPFENKLRECDHVIIKRVAEIAAKHSLMKAQVALIWSREKVTSFCVGASTLKRLEECIITGKTLTTEEIKYLEEAYESRPPRF